MKPSSAPLPRAHDHREIAQDMGVFVSAPLAGSGLPLWLPAGAIIRRQLEQYAHEIAIATGCVEVYSPVLGKADLFVRSGHHAKFAADMFPPMDAGGDQLVLRPANCPHHALIYASAQHSYRELPVRYHELGAMFRAERSGVLSGLSRVRQINLDDAHVFCSADQLEAEVELALGAVLEVLDTLGIEVCYLRLSRRDERPQYLGQPAQWLQAEGQLRAVLERVAPALPGIECREAPGEAAFYGPKIDVQVLDHRGHEESLATVQVDFNQPERFDLGYVAADGSQQRVSMIHRGVLGSMERLVAFLLERYDGRLPLWLAPVQLSLLPVSRETAEVAWRAAARLRALGLRVGVEEEGSLGARIRSCRRRRDALLGVIGEREAAVGQVSVHDPASDQRAELAVERLAELMVRTVAARAQQVDLAA